MKNLDHFDVLVVYSQALAHSASESDASCTTPFASWSRRANYNDAYAYFLKTCARNNLTAAFTTSADIIGTGKCRSYWLFQKNKWIKVNKPCSSNLIFDKFSPINIDQKLKRKLLFSSSRIKPFNNHYLFQLFFDKYKTYLKLKPFSIPTVAIADTKLVSIEKALKDLHRVVKNNKYKSDFTQDIVIKDRFGAGGNNIYKVTSNHVKEIRKIVKSKPQISFVIQPFLNFDKGFSYGKYSGLIDIRIIYSRGKIIQSYIRTAKEKDFRCNEHQGGKLVYIQSRDIPKKVLKLSSQVTKSLNKKQSLFALDFVITNRNNVYLLEGNTGPGLDWNLSERVNAQKAKLFIRTVVANLELMANKPRAKKMSSKRQIALVPNQVSIGI
jgi:hypothetical protein